MKKDKKENIYGYTYDALKNLLTEGFKTQAFVVNQLCKWLYERDETDFDKMTDLSLALRESLKNRFYAKLPQIAYRLDSFDRKTTKLKLQLEDGSEIESVLMREEKEEATLCVSSQVGCAQGCMFCATGKMGLKRNLHASEIVTQILLFRRLEGKKLKSLRVVYMGMGEPFHNCNQVFKSLSVVTHPKMLAIGARKITVSTSGVTKGIYRMAEEFPQVQLAISLHTVEQDIRNLWIPNHKESVTAILKAAKDFCDKTSRKITFEVILFGGQELKTSRINRFAKQIEGILCNINLIPYNPVEGGPHGYDRPSHEEIMHFREILQKWHKEVTVRISKGRDIQAACGQLIVATNS